MRDILFRAKSLSSGQWVYGNFIHSKRFSGYSHEFRIHEIESGIESDVDAITVGQFTGLVDSLGCQLFEGDVIECTKTKEKRIVTYVISSFMAEILVTQYSSSYSILTASFLANNVKIGNIYDPRTNLKSSNNGK